MPGSHEIARLINREARSTLAPLGLVQKGKSRTWLDDHVWWVTVVEFQPSKWGDASFLNVGICWLTYAKDYLSFDLGYRVREAVEFHDPAQFAKAMGEFAQLAASGVTALRRSVTSPASALHCVLEQLQEPGVHDWERYHAAVFAGLTGDFSLARRFLQEILAEAPQYPWQTERAARARQLLPLDSPAFRDRISQIVRDTRALLKLPPGLEPIL
jgi:hypothetical protein